MGIGEGDGDGIDAKGNDDGIDDSEGGGEDGGRGGDVQVEVLGSAFTRGTGMRW